MDSQQSDNLNRLMRTRPRIHPAFAHATIDMNV